MKGAWHGQFKRTPKAARTDRDGVVHDSKSEMQRWEQLKLWLLAGEISNLRRQVRHELRLPDGTPIKSPKGRVYSYTSDFEYTRNGEHIIEDHKGYWDKFSQFKISVFQAITGKKVTISKK